MPTAGLRVKALDFTAAQTDSDSTTHSNVGTTATAGSPEVGVTFTAPTSGKALISLGLRGQDDAAANSVFLDIEIYEDDTGGSKIVSTGTWERRLELAGDTSTTMTQNITKTFIETGLTAGQVYYARVMHHAAVAGSADVIMRRIDVTPLPA